MRLWRLRGGAKSPKPPPGADPWNAWRHRHGPDARLDALMRRCAAYWAEATAHLLLQDLDSKFR